MDDSIKKLSDPRSFGAGAWLIIHILAYNAKTNVKKKAFEDAVQSISAGLKCHTCQTHCVEYVTKNPIRDYWYVKSNAGEDIGMFKWSWIFHNAVNARLGKEILDYETAYHLYSDDPDTVCTKDCEGDGDDLSHKSQSPASPRPKRNYSNTHYSKNGLIHFVPNRTPLYPYRRR